MKYAKKLLIFLYNHLEYVFVAVLFIGVFYLAFNHGSFAMPYASLEDDPNYYANKIFDQSYVHKIELSIPERDLSSLRASPTEKTRYLADVIIDGESFKNVAFSTRGNASLTALAGDENSERYSYKVNFGKFSEHSSYHGLDKLILNNLNSDPSYLKDYLAFEIMRNAGVASPLTSFTELYINGELQGLYQAIEDVDESFLARNRFSPDAVLYKPEATAINNFAMMRLREQLPEGVEPDIVTLADMPGFDFGGSDLVYHGDDPAEYHAIFENAVSKISHHDEEYLISSLRALEPAEMLEPTDYWDVDALAKYFAANNLLSNFDSYTGITSHNYYLLASPKSNTLLPRDYNLGFAGLWLDPEIDYDEGVINWPIDSPIATNQIETRPAWRLIVENPDYLEKYHQAIQSLINNYLLNGECISEITKTAELIRSYVYSDPSRFYSIEEFEDGVEILRNFILVRADSAQKQLWGLIPSTHEEAKSGDFESIHLDTPLIDE